MTIIGEKPPKLLMSLFAVLALAIATAGCGGDAATPDSAGARKKVVLRLDWKLSGQQTPFLLARDKGLYEAAGLDVEIQEGSGSTDSAKLVGTGRIDFGIVDASVIVSSRAEGLPIKSVAVLYQKTPITILFLKDKVQIQQPSDLQKGIKLGINQKSAHAIGIDAMIKSQKLDRNRIEIVPIGPDAQPQLLSGQIDAMGGLANVDPPVLQDEGHAVSTLNVADYGINMYGLTIAANEKTINDDPELVKSFVQATAKGWAEAEKDPDAATELLLKSYPQGKTSLDKAIMMATTSLTHSPDSDEHGMGWQTEEKWSSTVQALAGAGAIDTTVNAQDCFSNVGLE
jgi:NitT/TauT family transport system substrate-binding protein